MQKLVEGHGRLSDELETARAAAVRVQELEQENKRLAQQLQERLEQQLTPLAKPFRRVQHDIDLVLTPGLGPQSSFDKIETPNGKPITKQQHEAVVKKYNSMCENYLLIRDKYLNIKKSYETLLQTDKEWETWMQSTQRTLEKKKDKTRRCEEEIRKLKALLRKHGIEPSEKPASTRDESTPSRPPPTHRTSEVQVPASSSPQHSQHQIQGRPIERARGLPAHAPDDEDIQPPPVSEVAENAERESEPLEGHDASSTQGGSDPVEPESPVQEASATVANPIEDTSFPVVITSRSVKKRKHPHDAIEQTPRSKIKVEILSSSPIGPAASDLDGSMDLDDIGEKVDTPRKPRQDMTLSRQVSGISSNTQDSTQSPSQPQRRRNLSNVATPRSIPQIAPNSRHTQSVLQPQSINKQILPRTSDGRDEAPKRRRVKTDIRSLTEDGESFFEAATRNPSEDRQCLEELLSRPSPAKAILMSPVRPPRSANRAPHSARPTASRDQQRTAPASSVLAREMAADLPRITGFPKYTKAPPNPSEERSISRDCLAPLSQESALTSRPSSQRSLQPGVSSEPSTLASPRISAEPIKLAFKASSRTSKEPTPEDDMMRSQTPEITRLPPRRDVHAFIIETKSKARPSSEVGKPSPRVSTATGRPGTTKKNQSRTEVDSAMDPAQEPLRSRPLAKLNLHDFKINPNYNQGIKYAYNEVTRGEARKCLQGCTKPTCCGPKFRGLAQMEIERREAFMTLSQEERDNLLLEEYLGDDASQIPQLSKDERRELLTQAVTRQQANKHGKHRHAYERRATPPGFWDVDFPSTQQEAEDRRLAKEREREIVEQRYREAMRPGGSYLFRDENP